MKKFLLASSAAAMAAFGLIACGDESTINQITQEGIPQIAAGESLGKCSDKNVGEMFFVTDSSAVYYCADGKWKSLNGRDGDKGDKGESGSSSVDTLVVRDTIVKLDTLVMLDSMISGKRDTIFAYDTLLSKDTVYMYDTTVIKHEPEYDTVTTEYLNQEMLAEGKYGTLIDKRDNKVYRTIEIGQQTWMAQNLEYETDGVYSYCHDNSQADCKKYGRMYRWAQALNLDEIFASQRTTNSKGADSILFRPARGICPSGFHIPDTSEVKALEAYVKAYNTIYYPGEDVITSLASKEESAGWNIASPRKASDRYGFAAMPAGGMNQGKFTWLGDHVYFWTSTEAAAASAFNGGLLNTATEFHYNNCTKQFFLSIRCIKDEK